MLRFGVFPTFCVSQLDAQRCKIRVKTQGPRRCAVVCTGTGREREGGETTPTLVFLALFSSECLFDARRWPVFRQQNLWLTFGLINVCTDLGLYAVKNCEHVLVSRVGWNFRGALRNREKSFQNVSVNEIRPEPGNTTWSDEQMLFRLEHQFCFLPLENPRTD